MPTPREILIQNRADAMDLVQKVGVYRAKQILLESQKDLAIRLMSVSGGADATFTREQMRATLLQIQKVIVDLNSGIRGVIVDGAADAADHATNGLVDYMSRAERMFTGVASTGLDLDTASMFEKAKVGARSSVLRRLMSSGEDKPGAPQEEHPAKQGILQRYGEQTVGVFESVLQRGVLARKPWGEMKSEIIGASTFLQGKPAFWAERIVRTELMGAYNRGSWEANREADDQLGDMVKILSATFDDRTGADSFAVHGQIRLPDEAFESWFGPYQHPPNRPNDREIVVPHRISWPIPPYLKWKQDAEILARWAKEKRKGAPPERPNMTTVPITSFGFRKPPKSRETEARPERSRVPDEE